MWWCRYNDEAVLENHHAATLFRVLNNPESNLLATLNVQERKQVRRTGGGHELA